MITPTPEQQLAGLFRTNLTEWNTGSLFPEGLGGKDVFRLRNAGEYFLGQREAEFANLHKQMEHAVQTQDGALILRTLDESDLLGHEVQRARIYYKLLSVQYPQENGFASLYETIAAQCNRLDAMSDSLPEPLARLPEETRLELLQKHTGLQEYLHALFPKEHGRFPGLSAAETATLTRAIQDEKTDHLHAYHTLHANGSIPATSSQRLEKAAEIFSAMQRTSAREAQAYGYDNPLTHFATWQHVPAELLTSWFDYANDSATRAAQSMHSLLTGDHLKYSLLKQHYPDGKQVQYSWAQAREIVTEALCKFNPNFRPILDDAFEQKWIQSKPLGTNPYGGETYNNIARIYSDEAHPMVLSEFRGGVFDVIRLAHELGGHCLSIELANRKGQHLHVTDSTLQETFALFSQRLVVDEMVSRATDPVQRAAILRTNADDLYQNLYETTSRCSFEQAAYRLAKQPDGSLRPLSANTLTRLFSEINAPIRYGTARIDDNEPVRWANIHHFVTQQPYYNASYSFATMASSILFDQWKQAEPGHQKAIAHQWNSIMEEGGLIRFPDAMQRLGIDIYTTNFFERGVQDVSRAIEQAQNAMGKISTLKLFSSLSVGAMLDTALEQTSRLFGKKVPHPSMILPNGATAARAAPSAPAQAVYGAPTPQQPGPAPDMDVSTQGQAHTKLQTSPAAAPSGDWANRVSNANAQQAGPPSATRWRDQATGSHSEQRPNLPTWSI
jgi:oligoendopeptidase F